MLNKLSFNLASSLNESESEILKVSKKVLIESDGIKTIEETIDPSKEERLASLKMQIEKDGEQLAADEKEAIEKEIAELEKEVYNESEKKEIAKLEDELDTARSDEKAELRNEITSIKGKADRENRPLNEEEGDSTFTLKINTSNAAFEDENEEGILVEVARILEDVSNNLEYTDEKSILDINGNVVGKYGFGFEGVSLGESEDTDNYAADYQKIIDALKSIDASSITNHSVYKFINQIILACESQIVMHKKPLTEEYSDKLGGDPEDFVSDVESIKAALLQIDTQNFGTHLAQQMIEDWVEVCNTQISRGKRLASGDEFYSESEEGCSKQTIEESAEVEVKNLQVIKEQGNVYMLEDENKKMIVGENYNAEEGLIENAEIYENKEDADKDYLSRCDIIKDGEEFKPEEKEEVTESEELTEEVEAGENLGKVLDELLAGTYGTDTAEISDSAEETEAITYVAIQLTDEGKEYFNDVLNYSVTEKDVVDGIVYITVDSNGNAERVNEFLNASSGNIGDTQFDKWFILE